MAGSWWPFWRFSKGASSSPANFVHLSRANIETMCELASHGEPLNPHQCRSMSSALKRTMHSVERLVDLVDVISNVCGSAALENFYRLSVKAKQLVEKCCREDWCREAAFQIQNEEAFREILLETSLIYNTIFEVVRGLSQNKEFLFEDLRDSSTFTPPSADVIFKDLVALHDRLEGLVSESKISVQLQHLGKYLLGRVKHALEHRHEDEDFDVLAAVIKEGWAADRNSRPRLEKLRQSLVRDSISGSHLKQEESGDFCSYIEKALRTRHESRRRTLPIQEFTECEELFDGDEPMQTGSSASTIASAATLPQQPSGALKYTKLWEGILSGQSQQKPVRICKLEAYRQISASEKLAANWPPTLQIVRLIAQDYMNNKEYQGKAEVLVFSPLSQCGFLDQLAEKKLCAVIQLPSQTLLLARTDKPGRMIGMLFPWDMVEWTQFKPYQPTGTQQPTGAVVPHSIPHAAAPFKRKVPPCSARGTAHK